MIELLFEFGPEVILVVINGNKITFGNTTFGAQMSDIDGLELDYTGVIREFPDLELADNWRELAIERFKEKIKEMKNEEEICEYIKEELEGKGYKAIQKRRQGFRPVKF